MDGAARLRLLHVLEAFLQAVRRRRTRHDADRLLVLLGGIADSELRLHRFGAYLQARTPEEEPVGFRISLARRPVARLVDRLLFDPDARVVQTILGNPRLTEAEVVKLAASRRAAPEVLEVIAQDDRWIARYPVKVALANNPTTPLRVVLGLLPYLLHQDLRAVAAGSSRAEVREQAASLLSRRLGA